MDKFIGNAGMAVCGAPRSHEDDVLQAGRAGLRVQQENRALNREKGVDLKIGVGIDAGEALWDPTGGEAYTVTGDAVNIAQRLEGICEPGVVTESEAVKVETGSRVRCHRLDPVQGKGRDSRCSPTRSLGVDEGEAPYRRVRGTQTRMVDREREMGC